MKKYILNYKYICKNPSLVSYDYQKFFRAIYGYQQNVTKIIKGKKEVYKYKLKGILKEGTFEKIGKCKILVNEEQLENLINFFKTGENPVHDWKNKDIEVIYKYEEIK